MKMQARPTVIIAFLTLACFFLVPVTSRAANLVANSGFSGASGTTVSSGIVQLGALPSWTFTPSSVPPTDVNGTYLLINSNDGVGGACCSADFGAVGSTNGTLSTYDEISQVITTTPGQQYDLSFYLQDDGGTPGDFQVEWDGLYADYPATTNGYDFVEYNYDVTGTGSDTLSFYGYDDGTYLELSDPSVTPVPEPSSIFMVLSGLAGLGEMVRRKVRA
jgi:hypothetical protein